MNLQAARMLNVASKITCSCQISHPVTKSSLKTLRNVASMCRLRAPTVCTWNLGTSAKSVTNLAVKFTSDYGHIYQQKLYSTRSTPQTSTDKQEVKWQSGFAEGEIEKTKFVTDETSGETRTRGKMKSYVRRASNATEKMKEKNENILTIPNLLSTTRLLLSPVLGYLVIQECYTVGACLFAVAGITDLLDGFIARNFKNQQSVLGSIIDPLADKCLVAILTLSLTVSGLIPVPLTVLMVSRDISLVGSVFYLRYQSLPPPRTLSRFFDITHATIQLKPTTISKLNTAVQLGLVGFTLIAPVFHYVDHPLLHALWYTTAATTILSGLSYAFSKDAFKFLRKG